MSFPSTLFTPSTWRNIGLGLTTVYFGLGALAIVAPATAGESLGVIPTTPEGHAINEQGMAFLGIRDVAVATALFCFYSKGQVKEAGVVTAAWTLVCVVDTWVATKGPRGFDSGIWALIAGAAVNTFVGLGLLQS